MRTSVILCLFFALIGASTASAGQLDMSLGFSGIQSASRVQNSVRGTLRYVDVIVNSNETTTGAVAQSFIIHLKAKGPSGEPLCFVDVPKVIKVKPPVFLLRFQVFYPSGRAPGDTARVVAPRNVDYTLKAWLDAPAGEVTRYNGTGLPNAHEFTFTFPGGGNAPVCRPLP